MADVVIDSVVKSFGSTKVLREVSIAIEHGEMLVILGPSGCGKSTLLRLIAGLEQMTSGEIRIGGRLVNDLEPMDRDIAMVFQNYALYPHMSVYDNMAYGLRNRRTAKAEIDRRVKEAAGILGLSDLLQRKPRQLSGGQRQRVAMGRAIVREPTAFLFDEPLSNLDAKLRVQMRMEIKHLQRRLDVTAIYVTHDQIEAMTLGDRLMVLNQGQVEQIGRPLDVYAWPASTFVAGFIGSPAMNLLPATLESGGAAVRVDGALLDLPAPVQGPTPQEVLLGVRPEHLSIVPEDRPGLPLEVAWCEALGADTLVHGRSGDGTMLAIRLEGTAHIEEGRHLRLEAADPSNLHLFAKDTGRRVN